MSGRQVNLVTYSSFKTFIATFAVLGLSAGATAQEAPAPEAAAPAEDEATTQQHAVQNIQLFFAALNSEEVSQEVKNALVGCIYQNSMRQITVAMDKAIEANSATIDRNDSSQMVGLMASICGYQPQNAGAGAQPQPSGSR
jgi:hypothetical protein